MNRLEAREYILAILGADLHLKRVDSLADGTLGVLESAAVGISAIGRGLAAAEGLNEKHAIKQVDRLIGNEGIDVEKLSPAWVRHVIGDRKELVVNLDWTEFDRDGHSMLVMALQTGRGRSTPLLWKSVVKSELKGKMNTIEDELIQLFRDIIPIGVKVTLVADRGFGSVSLYKFLDEIGFFYVIRFRSNVTIMNSVGERKKAIEWLGSGMRSKIIRNAKVTHRKAEVPIILVAKDPGMKDAWCLASNIKDASVSQLKKIYGRRFTIEETFRDLKDLRFGMGLSWRRVTKVKRRDRLFLLACLAHALLMLLGQAGENLGMDRLLKANTSKKRVLSLFRQGARWYAQIPKMPTKRLRPLMKEFGELLDKSLLYGHIQALNPQ